MYGIIDTAKGLITSSPESYLAAVILYFVLLLITVKSIQVFIRRGGRKKGCP